MLFLGPNTPWIVGAIAFLIFFTIFESYALRHPDRENTLSHFVASIGAEWPLSIALYGLVTGVLLAHFFWPWCGNPLGAGIG
jgi:4-hydroxybenzoate polyprenyltransferase